MMFSELLGLFQTGEVFPESLFEEIQLLLERKAVTEEKDQNPHMPMILDFIRNECLIQKKISADMSDDHVHDLEPLNRVFINTLGLTI